MSMWCLCEKCKPIELEAMRALESLTPGGSEFVNDPKRCVAFAREHSASQMRVIVDLTKRLRALECHCSASTGICGCTTYGTGKLDHNGYWSTMCPHGREVHTCFKEAQ